MKMRRREFIAGFGGAAAWPLAARAQQGERVRRIGVLMGGNENDPVTKSRISALTQALAALGWTDGRNVWMDLRWAGANTNRMRALAQERPLSSFRGAIPSPAASPLGSTSRAGTQRHRSNAPSLVEAIGQPAPRRMRSAKLAAAVTPIGYERSRRRPKPNCRQGCIPRSPGCARPEGGERRWRHRACRYG